ncbi:MULTISPECIES: 2-oxo-4-hydroxy-4-carboxy-5-ureidoimidazoline decarboxylase [Nocardiaceae]|jgi:2-oxo-4-hydroxy-4-carboxy-5-ureidoimidazoline decarboxylase|uniref:2-oxo-4-hydroxy-4-carboxy-5-ureidoimidazoline decarboxylase n=1 Tax=Nocardiaceae TaxID=85025 RepID=UPI000378DA06|nr:MULTISPECIES: 2-oxo-4-hydroxy-4-carboxy-5-ureidoimidazoline decarboxylase [Rhodococcus]OZC53042.1 2-oxo-4-hydroxy-4-carboxy-5-ureidoimidazoline decarboxylase [Rhodococcus sp. RS1C4]OZC77570.1 2-oxo-4-hydroxy-4-carboxy-5-ureidoimidazoline decarboxylase [Rhodococcus sp. 06-418-1B]OZC77617.1 2-oxo-4-hydroxy-4-carboxy-5-ureidoimidazoline decarboxylase [Rhodococcus sp. 06-418-1B]OZD14992.1 2-oxo-4-hydroxy-4-carboxy-5-ureidoimidazoline decarboxylase [Rhodococcus sp. 06-156-4C]OZD19924.1 2-oxo-4-h
MMMHQGLGLETFNDLPRRKAVHALYECSCSHTWASRVADARPYGSYSELFARADAELAELSDADVDYLASTLRPVGRTCAGMDPATQSVFIDACRMYIERFGYGYIVCSTMLGDDSFRLDPRAVLVDLGHRLDNSDETERKVMRDELAKINRTRIERVLGPEDGWPPY